ncbi:MAG: PaaD-like zinc ribbon domain-containing protein [Solirubrobacteraceae bacterium]
MAGGAAGSRGSDRGARGARRLVGLGSRAAPVSATELACPFCESRNIELVSAWGGQLITSQMRCRDCNTYFEALRDHLWTSSSGEDR